MAVALLVSACSSSASSSASPSASPSASSSASSSASPSASTPSTSVTPVKAYNVAFANVWEGNTWGVQSKAEFYAEVDRQKAAGRIGDVYYSNADSKAEK